MEEKTIVIEDVTQAWRTLYLDIQKKSKLKIEAFNEVFSQTYTLLTERLPDSSLDKEIVALVAEAYLFANLKGEHYDSTCLASFILTERMLSYCAFSSAPAAAATLPVYVMEARKDVRLSFSDVGDSMTKLVKILEDFYWKQLSN